MPLPIPIRFRCPAKAGCQNVCSNAGRKGAEEGGPREDREVHRKFFGTYCPIPKISPKRDRKTGSGFCNGSSGRVKEPVCVKQ